MAVSADALKQIGTFGMFQCPCKFHLADQQQREKIAFIVLHIGQKTQIIEIGRGEHIGFVDDNDYFLP